MPTLARIGTNTKLLETAFIPGKTPSQLGLGLSGSDPDQPGTKTYWSAGWNSNLNGSWGNYETISRRFSISRGTINQPWTYGPISATLITP